MQTAGHLRLVRCPWSRDRIHGALAVFALAIALVPLASAHAAASDADTYRAAITKLNEAHAAKPGDTDEASLALKLPKPASAALARLLAAPKVPSADLLAVGEAALDLDRIDDFEAIRAKLVQLSPGDAPKLGIALSRPRFLLRGVDGVEPPALEAIADTLDLVLDAYRDVFHFANWSKVPGKKLRVRVHLVPEIEQPPHFAPQFPWHSEIDFPVVAKDEFRSPTADGKFLFYGLCHELGHVIAMWGDTTHEGDHHAWAHYTGVVVVEHLSNTAKENAVLRGLRDAKWRTLTLERKELEKVGAKPGFGDRKSVLAWLAAVHLELGPAAIGDALNALESKGRVQRVNHVRYYDLDDLRSKLESVRGGRGGK